MLFRRAIPIVASFRGYPSSLELCRAALSTVTDVRPPKISIVEHPFPLDGQPIPAVTQASDRFAVIEHSGTQFKLTIVRHMCSSCMVTM